MNVFVTGATGFIGKNLVPILLKKGKKVICLVRKGGDYEFLSRLGAKIVLGDVSDYQSIKKGMKGCSIVYHLAAIADGSAKISYDEYYKVNVLGTRNIVKACIENKVKRLVYCSSITAMGTIRKYPIDENAFGEITNSYSRSKLEAEREVFAAVIGKGLDAVIIRPTMVYGKGANKRNDIYKIANLVKKGFFPLFGSGNNTIPMINVNDIANALILAGKKGRKGEAYIITNEKHTSLKALVTEVGKALGKKPFFIKIPIPLLKLGASCLEIFKLIGVKPPLTRAKVESSTTDRIINISKAKNELGFKEKVSVSEGIRQMLSA